MTIKALTNMYLLLHLMDREQAGRVPALLPGRRGRTSTSATRPRCWRPLQLGFVPILASVKPQVSAHVAIDLEGGSGPNGIYIDEADWKYIRRDAAASGETRVASEPEEAGEPA